MYAITSTLLVRRTFATLRSAEFGFLGVVVYTRVHTPRRNGFALSAGDLSLVSADRRPWRMSWLIVGIRESNRASYEPVVPGAAICGRRLRYRHLRPRSTDCVGYRSAAIGTTG